MILGLRTDTKNTHIGIFYKVINFKTPFLGTFGEEKDINTSCIVLWVVGCQCCRSRIVPYPIYAVESSCFRHVDLRQRYINATPPVAVLRW
jgi:hypothetical protein